VDIDPDKAGKDLGELCGIEPLGIAVSGSLNEAIAGKQADVALLTTVSSIVSLESQVAEIAEAGLNIVSTCEELFFPWKTNPEVARRIDRICRESEVTCVGTGVNPGYLMDFLPTILSGLCQDVKKVEVWRVQDASVRRIPFQQKIGAALTLEEFEDKKNEGSLRHVGLPESVDFVADRFGWELDRSEETLDPVIAEAQIDRGYKPISKGMACGVHQVGRGFVGDEEIITLNFRAAVGEPESYDRVRIEGEPVIDSRIAGGVNGDIATCAITLNTVRSVLEADPGLKTMAQIPPIGFIK
ncbi:MAG: NAD(P)H-dependent amine dehydrogenase family protein, partial [Planctomycetota bacterium]